MKRLTLTFGIVILLGGASLAAQHSPTPAGMSHEAHLRQLQKDEAAFTKASAPKALKHRGGLAMGFDQDKVRCA